MRKICALAIVLVVPACSEEELPTTPCPSSSLVLGSFSGTLFPAGTPWSFSVHGTGSVDGIPYQLSFQVPTSATPSASYQLASFEIGGSVISLRSAPDDSGGFSFEPVSGSVSFSAVEHRVGGRVAGDISDAVLTETGPDGEATVGCLMNVAPASFDFMLTEF